MVMFIQVAGYFVRAASHKVVERVTLLKYGQVCVLWALFIYAVFSTFFCPSKNSSPLCDVDINVLS